MSKKQHTKDQAGGVPHHKASSSGGGKCLNRHVGGTPPPKDNSCSHRWQAWLQMCDDSSLYNWDKYKSLAQRKSRIPVWDRWGFGSIGKPKAKEWDVGKNSDNFTKRCYRPYWHEAHHIVPNSTLRKAINQFGKEAGKGAELAVTIRRGLAGEAYNLNEKNNMIMLPMGKVVARVLGLPRHRITPSMWSHTSYSAHVKSELHKSMSELKQELSEHENPEYQSLKKKIVAISERLYPKIVGTPAKTLDDMDAAEFADAPEQASF